MGCLVCLSVFGWSEERILQRSIAYGALQIPAVNGKSIQEIKVKKYVDLKLHYWLITIITSINPFSQLNKYPNLFMNLAVLQGIRSRSLDLNCQEEIRLVFLYVPLKKLILMACCCQPAGRVQPEKCYQLVSERIGSRVALTPLINQTSPPC